jgi:hypothetical protein
VPEAVFDVLDAGLERGDAVLQGREIVLEDLAAPAILGESRLDPAQGLRDRVLLPFHPLESPIEFIEVAEHLAAQPGDLLT